MKRKAIIILFLVILSATYAVEVCVYEISRGSDVDWTISNDEGHVEYASEDFLGDSICYMDLPADQHFSWNMVVNHIQKSDTVLMALAVEDNVVLAVSNTISLGDNRSTFMTGTKTPVMKIVGGENASIEDFPWQVFFSFGNYMCGGTIIADRWILTAAHCTQNDAGQAISATQMDVLVGASNRNNGTGKWYSVDNYSVHENYNNKTLVNDIAVLELKEVINYPNAEVISLISSEDVSAGATDPGVMATVTGWGYVDPTSQTLSYDLQQVSLPIVANNVADDVWGTLETSILSAGYKNGNKDACNGDSGGPLVVDVNGTTKIAGIVSFGSENCNTYGGYTRVSSFLSWIEDKTQVVPLGEIALLSGESFVCYATQQTDYEVSNGGTAYEWVFSPSEAGLLSFDGNKASIQWTDGFVGDAQLSVRADIGGHQSSWKSLDISVLPLTKILSYSEDTIVCEGEYVALEVQAEGHDLSYDWYKNGTYYKTTLEPRWVFVAADTLNTASYKCLVKGSCGDEMTGDMELTVWPSTRVTVQGDLDVDVKQGENTELYINAIGHHLSYQWYKDNVLIDDATLSVFELSDANALDIGDYYAVVMGSCSSDTSKQVYVYVDDQSLLYNARIWPSVSRDFVHVAISTDFRFDVYLYDINGVLKLKQLENMHNIQLDVNDLPSGLYFIHVESESLNEVFRFLKP